MKKFKKLLLVSLCLVLVVALTIAGTVAFLQDEDGEINVMTVGNVRIEQIEEQFDENGELEAFEQNKLLYPVPEVAHNNDTFLQAVTTLAPEVNVVDKIVTVKNTGKSEAYLRTVFAIEMGAVDVDAFLASVVLNVNTADWTWTSVGKTYINGSYYYLVVAQYNVALPAKATSNFSLGQVFLKASVGNEVCEAIDGNGNGTLDILTMSQAVQTVGFGNATAALTAAFGEVTTVNHPWASNEADFVVENAEQLQAALTVGGKIKLADHITVAKDTQIVIPEGAVVVLDMNEKTIIGGNYNATSNAEGYILVNNGTLLIKGDADSVFSANGLRNGYGAILNNGDLTLKGGTYTGSAWDGTAGDTPGYTVRNQGNMTVEPGTAIHGTFGSVSNPGGTLTINGGTFTNDDLPGVTNYLVSVWSNGKIIINDGDFTFTSSDANAMGSPIVGAWGGGTIIINGGTFDAEQGAMGYASAPITITAGLFKNAAKNVFQNSEGVALFKAASAEAATLSDGSILIYPVTDTWDGTADISWYPTVATAAESNTNSVYYLYTAEQLAGLAELVNVHGVKFKNSTIKLMVNVDLDNRAWTPVGHGNTFEGADYVAGYAIFDGNNKTISNLSVDVNSYSGLFGAAKYATIKNINVVNAEINSNHWAGVILAQGYAQVENCTVKNATVTCTPEFKNGEWDNGDKAGGIAGQITEGSLFYVKNCSVEKVTVTAYRDLGGILGYANQNVSVIGNSATNVTLNINKEHDYKTDYTTDADYDASLIVGDARQSGVKVEDNKYNGVICVANADQLANVVAAGYTNIWLADGVYNVKNCGGKTLTISGSKNAVIKIYNEGEDGCDYGFDGSKVTFNGVTIDTTANNGNYKGFARLTATFNNCTIFGAYTTHQVQTFNNCTFDTNNGYIWIWGATKVTFNGCTFNGNSKAILAHGSASTIININNCTFAATEKGYTGSGDNTAAIEIDPTGTNTYTINFTGNNTITDAYAGWTRVKDGSTGHKTTTPTVVEDATALDNALNSGNNVVLNEDLLFNASETTANSGYGATGVAVKGGTLDGDGNSIGVNNWGTWDCAVNTTGGTIQNLTINSGMRGIFMGSATADVYIDNVIIDGTVYTFNSDGGNKNYGVYISNSTLNGWTSHSDVHKEVVYTNCNFGEGQGYAFCRPYGPTTFENCVFEEGFKLDTSKTSDIVFINCYYGDTLITSDNAATLGDGETTFFYNGLNGITIR